jgi:ABC-type Fe3+/spermidine/putrescine transport system ATPase subunit
MVMSDRIAIMQSGHIIQIGTPAEIYRAPANRFVASFMGEVNILEVEHERFGDIDQPAPAHARRYAVVRPEALRPGAGDIRADLTVTQQLMLGSRSQLHLRAPSGATLISEVAGDAAAFAPGTTHAFGFSAADIAWVDE